MVSRNYRLPLMGMLLLFILIAGTTLTTAEAKRNKKRNKKNHNPKGGKQLPKDYLLYKDPKQPVESRVEDLLKRMTLAEKIGQMTQIERINVTSDIVREYMVGSLLSGGGSVPKRHATPQDWVDMVNDFQNGALKTRLGIPMIYSIDAVHGHNNVDKATIFPHNVGLGATRDTDLVMRIGAATALETVATGIPYAFAPCIAVCRDPRWGRCYESYSEDHTIVQQMTDIIYGLQGKPPANYPKNYPYMQKGKVLGCAKHYVGDGGTVNGINENNTIIDWNGLTQIHMPAYLDSIRKGIATIMVSYSSWNGVKMHAHRDLITYLKGTLNFKGFVISDYQGIDKITSPAGSNYTYSVEASINAGIDMIMVPYDYKGFIGNLTLLVNKQVVPMSRIDDAVRRILRVKFLMGLFESPKYGYSLADKVGSQEHRELAREAVRKSLVLLKNGKRPNSPMLPLDKNVTRILVAGSHANDLGAQCGGWTIEWQGQSGNNVTQGTTILGAISKTVDPRTEIIYSKNPSPELIKNNKYDYAIVVVGEPPFAETMGDSMNLTIPEPGPSVIKNVCASVKCAVVIVAGRPLVVEPYLNDMDALVTAWLPGSEGLGVTDVLFGEYGFTGRLPRTWFKNVNQLPMNVGDPHYDPLFPFGFGLFTNPKPKDY